MIENRHDASGADSRQPSISRGQTGVWLGVLVFLGFLALISFLAFQGRSELLRSEVELTEQAGRLRMRILHAALLVEQLYLEEESERRILRGQELEREIDVLRESEREILHSEIVRELPFEVETLERTFAEYLEKLERVASGEFDPGTLERVRELASLDGLVKLQEGLVTSILDNSQEELSLIERLRSFILAVESLVLLLSGLCIFRPMDRRIRRESRALEEVNEKLRQKAHDLDQTVATLRGLRSEDQRRTRAMLSITEDLELKRQELELKAKQRQRARKLSRSAVEAAPNGMLMINVEGEIVLVNSQVEKLFRYSKDELLGRPVEILIPHRYRLDHPRHRRSYFLAPEARPMGGDRELVGLRSDGTEFPVEVGLNPLETDEGVFVMASVVDITERRESELQLANYRSELEAKNSELEEILYIVTHDLKSPLVTLQGFTGLLLRHLENDDREKVMDAAERIQRATSRMSHLLEDLLQLSRVGRVEDDFTCLDLNAVLEEVRESLAPQLEERQARLVLEEGLPWLNFSQTRLTQIFDNLLNNALKYGCPEPDMTIEVGSERRDGEILLYVRDRGPGVPTEYHKQIFLLFQRLDSRDEEGTGLGLAIVSKILELVGGTIWIDSDRGHGSTFWIRFPPCLLKTDAERLEETHA